MLQAAGRLDQRPCRRDNINRSCVICASAASGSAEVPARVIALRGLEGDVVLGRGWLEMGGILLGELVVASSQLVLEQFIAWSYQCA